MSSREVINSSKIDSCVARGRARFNLGDHWGAHEALERAWLVVDGPPKVHLQGMIQAAAAFHKLIVEDNAIGAERLLSRALAALEYAPEDAFGLAIDQLRAELKAWRNRLPSMVPVDDGRVVGVPRLEWAASSLEAEISVDTVRLHRVSGQSRKSIVVEIRAGSAQGWGECRVPWRDHGPWTALKDALAPALVSEKFRAPSSLPVHFEELASESAAVAGIEHAAWDLWRRVREISLDAALGIAARPLSEARRFQGHDLKSITNFLAGDEPSSNGDPLVIELRPNADRRIAAALAEMNIDFGRLILDLGGAYRPADSKVIEALDRLGPMLIARPYPAHALAEGVRLRSWLRSPLAMGPFASEREADSARRIGACDVFIVDPLVIGATATIDIAEMAETYAIPIWLAGSASTPFGAQLERALAMHSAFALPPMIGGAGELTGFEDTDTNQVNHAEERDVAAEPSEHPDAVLISTEDGPTPKWLVDVVSETWTLKA